MSGLSETAGNIYYFKSYMCFTSWGPNFSSWTVQVSQW